MLFLFDDRDLMGNCEYRSLLTFILVDDRIMEVIFVYLNKKLYCSFERIKFMRKYGAVLDDAIEREISGIDYRSTVEDRLILNKMFEEINETVGGDYHYLAEIDHLYIKGAGLIAIKYIKQFSSESVRAFLLPHIWLDVGKPSSDIIYELYLHFKESEYYISKPYKASSAHIYVRYDNAFWRLKPKKIKNELLNLIHNPRDAFYLPFTTRMLASWRMDQMEDLLISYLDSDNISNEILGICSDDKYYPSAEFIKRELRFTAITGLKYYPSDKNIELIKPYSKDTDKDVKACAQKTLKAYSKAMGIDII